MVKQQQKFGKPDLSGGNRAVRKFLRPVCIIIHSEVRLPFPGYGGNRRQAAGKELKDKVRRFKKVNGFHSSLMVNYSAATAYRYLFNSFWGCCGATVPVFGMVSINPKL
jgi:hypothetical protein